MGDREPCKFVLCQRRAEAKLCRCSRGPPVAECKVATRAATTRSESGRLRLEMGVIRYTHTFLRPWAIEVPRLRLIGEYTDESGPYADDWFLLFSTGEEQLYEASVYADGTHAVLSELALTLRADLTLGLTFRTDLASRVLWPPEIAGHPLFEYRELAQPGVIGGLKRILGLREVQARFTDAVAELLG